jgi:hypothetical protein
MFPITPDVAADTGVHLGDGDLYIRQQGANTNYRYSVTGHATEDQLYLLGQVCPIIASAYGLERYGVHVNHDGHWMSLRFQSKDVALFKWLTLGLPNGRKTRASIPIQILEDGNLMRHFAREILATDGLLAFYSANRASAHRYPRIQIKLTSKSIIQQLAKFLRTTMGLSVSCRLNVAVDGWGTNPRHILQINRREDIETWNREIGFSNPTHASRMMVYDILGECPPGTRLLDRLSFLSGSTRSLVAHEPISVSSLDSVINQMRKKFKTPRLGARRIVRKMEEINTRPYSRSRLEEIVVLRAAGEI